jgi:hypothetical protein
MRQFFYRLGQRISRFFEDAHDDFYSRVGFWAKSLVVFKFMISFLVLGLLAFVLVFLGMVFFFLGLICKLVVWVVTRRWLALQIYRLASLFRTNNGRLALAWKMTGILLIASIVFSFGYSMIGSEPRHEEIPSKYHQAFYSAYYETKLVESEKVFMQFLHRIFSVHGWLWASFGIFLLFSLVYTPIAYREEVVAAEHEVYYRLRERESSEGKTTVASIPDNRVGSAKLHSFKRLFSIDVLAEFAWEAVKGIFGGIFSRR